MAFVVQQDILHLTGDKTGEKILQIRARQSINKSINHDYATWPGAGVEKETVREKNTDDTKKIQFSSEMSQRTEMSQAELQHHSWHWGKTI